MKYYVHKNVFLNGQIVEPGTEVEFKDEEAAKPLLERGTISTKPLKDKSEEPKAREGEVDELVTVDGVTITKLHDGAEHFYTVTTDDGTEETTEEAFTSAKQRAVELEQSNLKSEEEKEEEEVVPPQPPLEPGSTEPTPEQLQKDFENSGAQ